MPLPALTFLIGGASSGKSAYGEQIVNKSGLEKVYIATSRIYDAEMQAKVDEHIIDRGDGWLTVEEPIDLPSVLAKQGAGRALFIDCATMWLTNLVMDERDIGAATNDLLGALSRAKSPVVIVSNEVGLGIVPENALARRFRQLQGRLNAQLAAQADTAIQVVAGLPILLKGRLPS